MERRFITLLVECSIKVLNIKHLPQARQSYAECLAGRHAGAGEMYWRWQGCIMVMLAAIGGTILTCTWQQRSPDTGVGMGGAAVC